MPLAVGQALAAWAAALKIGVSSDEMTLTGLEPGGGVPPGETPPGEASTTWQQPDVEDKTQSKGVTGLWLGVIGLIVLLVLVFIIGNIVGIFQMF